MRKPSSHRQHGGKAQAGIPCCSEQSLKHALRPTHASSNTVAPHLRVERSGGEGGHGGCVLQSNPGAVAGLAARLLRLLQHGYQLVCRHVLRRWTDVRVESADQ